jgi:hypothetical protein
MCIRNCCAGATRIWRFGRPVRENLMSLFSQRELLYKNANTVDYDYANANLASGEQRPIECHCKFAKAKISTTSPLAHVLVITEPCSPSNSRVAQVLHDKSTLTLTRRFRCGCDNMESPCGVSCMRSLCVGGSDAILNGHRMRGIVTICLGESSNPPWKLHPLHTATNLIGPEYILSHLFQGGIPVRGMRPWMPEKTTTTGEGHCVKRPKLTLMCDVHSAPYPVS